MITMLNKHVNDDDILSCYHNLQSGMKNLLNYIEIRGYFSKFYNVREIILHNI